MNNKLTREIAGFSRLWQGGFRSGYSGKRNQNLLELYLRGSLSGKDYTVLEIGCGGGQWSKGMYPHVECLYCIDVLSEDHNKFWEYVGPNTRDRISYHQVSDFSLSCIPDESLDYVFSYDVFCHISLSGQEDYLKNLRRKCKPGAILNIMYSDVDKYFRSESQNIHVWAQELYAGNGANGVYKGDQSVFHNHDKLKSIFRADCDGEPWPGRWYWVGIDNFISLCKKHGYEIIEKDLNIDQTNPITLFKVRTPRPE